MHYNLENTNCQLDQSRNRRQAECDETSWVVVQFKDTQLSYDKRVITVERG